MEAVRSSDANTVGEREAWTWVIMGEIEGARRLGIFSGSRAGRVC